MRPLIGITAGNLKTGPNGLILDKQSRNCLNAVERAGGETVVIPETIDMAMLETLYLQLNGIVLAGGPDIDPLSYGDKPSPLVHETSIRRDRREIWLARAALRDNKPIFAICRGMQQLNRVMGGNLYEDLPTQFPSPINHRQDHKFQTKENLAHSVNFDPDSLFAHELGRRRLLVNSIHHEALRKLGRGLVAVGWADDGVIEAVEAPAYNYVRGVQFHAESLEKDVVVELRVPFEGLVDGCHVATTPRPAQSREQSA